jgi:hypothetical protein
MRCRTGRFTASSARILPYQKDMRLLLSAEGQQKYCTPLAWQCGYLHDETCIFIDERLTMNRALS